MLLKTILKLFELFKRLNFSYETFRFKLFQTSLKLFGMKLVVGMIVHRNRIPKCPTGQLRFPNARKFVIGPKKP